MISVREVHKSFGSVHAVRGVSFQLDHPQVVGLLGPNGAGKSTTIRMIAGYLPPDRGEVRIGELDILSDSLEARRRIGYLPESAPIYPEMRTLDYLRFRARVYAMTPADRRRRIGEVVDRCELQPVRKRRIGQLSKGYRQRVGLAAAMLHDPPVLILDEPTNGLDPTQIRAARDLIRELGRDRTLLICSHILAEIERTCDRVIVIAGGKVRADGSPDELVAGAASASACIVECRPGTGTRTGAGTRTGTETADPESLIRSVHGVHAVTCERNGDWVHARALPSPGTRKLAEAIGRTLTDAGVELRRLETERPSLESVFMRAIESDAEQPLAAGTDPIEPVQGGGR